MYQQQQQKRLNNNNIKQLITTIFVTQVKPDYITYR